MCLIHMLVSPGVHHLVHWSPSWGPHPQILSWGGFSPTGPNLGGLLAYRSRPGSLTQGSRPGGPAHGSPSSAASPTGDMAGQAAHLPGLGSDQRQAGPLLSWEEQVRVGARLAPSHLISRPPVGAAGNGEGTGQPRSPRALLRH